MGQATPADKLKNLATNYFDTDQTVVSAVVDLASSSPVLTGSKLYIPLTVAGATSGTGIVGPAQAPNGGFAEPGAMVAIAFTDTAAAADQATFTVTPAGWKEQGVSALTDPITAATTTVSLTAGTGALFPATGSVYINGAEISYSGKSTDDLTGCDCTPLANGAAAGSRVVAPPVTGTMLFDGTGFVTPATGIGAILRWNGQSWDCALSNFPVQLA